MLDERGLQYTTWEGWEKLDAHEIALGQPHDRARIKVVPREGMLEASRG
jgi:ferredoxin--NADP+ reductase